MHDEMIVPLAKGLASTLAVASTGTLLVAMFDWISGQSDTAAICFGVLLASGQACALWFSLAALKARLP